MTIKVYDTHVRTQDGRYLHFRCADRPYRPGIRPSLRATFPGRTGH
nr:DUF2024 family protein [Pseudomonas sp. NFACC17-2]